MLSRQITLRPFAIAPNSFTTISLQAHRSLLSLSSLYNQRLTASFHKMPGGGYTKPPVRHRANLPSSLFLMTSLQPPSFHAVPHSFARRRVAYSHVFSDLRTLLTVTGSGGSLDLVHRDSAQKLRVKVSRLLRQHFSRRRDAHHLLHITSVQKERDLRCAPVHRIQRRRGFALVRQILLGGNRLRRDA